MSKHTPGPWRIHETPTYYGIMADARVLVAVVNKSKKSKVETEANLILLASAENLLAALEQINSLACYASEEDTSKRAEVLLAIGDTARKAISEISDAV